MTHSDCQLVVHSAAVNVKRVSLELGGKSPLIIFADCDMDKAVRLVSSSQKREEGLATPLPAPPHPSSSGLPSRVLQQRRELHCSWQALCGEEDPR